MKPGKRNKTACIVQVGACTRAWSVSAQELAAQLLGPSHHCSPPHPPSQTWPCAACLPARNPRKAPDTQGGNSTRYTCARNKAMAISVHSRAGARGARPHQRWLAQPRST